MAGLAGPSMNELIKEILAGVSFQLVIAIVVLSVVISASAGSVSWLLCRILRNLDEIRKAIGK